MAAKAHDSENYSRLEVDDRFLHTAKYSVPNTDVSASPQVYDDNLPEVHQARDDGFVATADPSPKPNNKICGIRRRLFWILLGVIVVIATAGAVGGALGAGTQSSPSTPGNPEDVLRETKLATINFTDVYGHSNYFVYYQKNSNKLYESAYNSSLRKWTVSRVGDETFRRGTHISANIFRTNATERNIHVYAVYDNGYLTGRIRNTKDTSPSVPEWGQRLGKNSTPLNGSRIASYGRENVHTLTKNIVVFQDGDGKVFLEEWNSLNRGPVESISQPISKTGLALVPIYGGDQANLSLAMFDVVAGSNSPRYVNLSVYKTSDREYNAWNETGISGSYDLTESASIAGFSVGTSRTGDVGGEAGSDVTVHLLILEPGQPMSTVSFKAGSATDGGVVKGIGNDTLLSMATCQSRRVYGTVAKDDGTVKIMEWEWVSDNQYKEVGEVNTTMEEN